MEKTMSDDSRSVILGVAKERQHNAIDLRSSDKKFTYLSGEQNNSAIIIQHYTQENLDAI